MNWILPVGLGVAVAALVLAAKKKNDEDELIRKSPGLPPASTMHPTGTSFPYITPRANYFNV